MMLDLNSKLSSMQKNITTTAKYEKVMCVWQIFAAELQELTKMKKVSHGGSTPYAADMTAFHDS